MLKTRQRPRAARRGAPRERASNGIVRVSSRAEFYRGPWRPLAFPFYTRRADTTRKFRNLSATRAGERFEHLCILYSGARVSQTRALIMQRVSYVAMRLDTFANATFSLLELAPRLPHFCPAHERRYDLVKERVLHSSSRRRKRMPKGRSLDGLPLRGWRMDSNSQG